jgi:hypothetical protein
MPLTNLWAVVNHHPRSWGGRLIGGGRDGRGRYRRLVGRGRNGSAVL